MRNMIFFLIIGTLISLVLIACCSAICAGIIIVLAKLINERMLEALPFSVIAGIVLSVFFYGKIMRKIMTKFGLNNKK